MQPLLDDRVAATATDLRPRRPILFLGGASLAAGVAALGVALVADGIVGDAALALAAPFSLTGLCTTAAALATRIREHVSGQAEGAESCESGVRPTDVAAVADVGAAPSLDSASSVNIDRDEVTATVQRIERAAAAIGAFIVELEAGFGGRPPVLADTDLRHDDEYPSRGLELLQRHAGLTDDMSDELLATLHLATELSHAMRAAIAELEARRSSIVRNLGDDASFRSLDAAVRAAFENYADLHAAVSHIDELLARVPRAPDRV